MSFRFDPLAPGATLAGCEDAIRAALPEVPEMEAAALAARLGAVTVLDVREAAEHAVGRIPGSRPVASGMGAAAVAALVPGGVAVLACSVGLRSGRLARDLLRAGMAPDRVFNLRGGVFRWARLGLPMVDDRGATISVHPFDARWGRLRDR